MDKNIERLIRGILPEITAVRQHLHSMPELAGHEVETSAFLRRELAALPGITVLEPFIGTDVVAVLSGAFPGKNVALRADIDGLAVCEKSDLPYKSQNNNMHACGHDGHTAMLLGAARVLSALRGELAGTVKFIFQPGEEVKALGRQLVNAGVLDNPPVDMITAMHNWPGEKLGTFATRPGAIMASAAHFYITLTGRGGHGSAPEKSVDPIIAGAVLIQALQTVVSRNADPQEAALLSICRVQSSGSSSNVIPQKLELAGTTRALSAENARMLEKRLREITSGVAAAMNVQYEIIYNADYPVTLNNPEMVEFAQNIITDNFGAERFRILDKSAMAAEDFAYYLQKVPGMFVRLGCGVDALPLHHESFDFNDGLLEHGISYLVAFAVAGGKRP